MTVNRKDIARRISEETGYYIQDIEEILEAESKAIVDFIDEGQEKIKNHKLYQIEVIEKPEKRAWNGLDKKYYTIPSKKVLKIKTMKYLEEANERLRETD